MRRTIVLATLLALALGACTSSKTFGGDDDIEGLRGNRPPPTDIPSAKPPKNDDRKKDDTKADEPPKPEAPTYKIVIQGGTCGIGKCGYEPSEFAVFLGTIVVVKNKDSVARSWVSDDDGKTFNSGPIQPGKEYRWKSNKVGQFFFRDGTANYITGIIVVQPPPE